MDIMLHLVQTDNTVFEKMQFCQPGQQEAFGIILWHMTQVRQPTAALNLKSCIRNLAFRQIMPQE